MGATAVAAARVTMPVHARASATVLGAATAMIATTRIHFAPAIRFEAKR